jgi:hypothetical protein
LKNQLRFAQKDLCVFGPGGFSGTGHPEKKIFAGKFFSPQTLLGGVWVLFMPQK